MEGAVCQRLKETGLISHRNTRISTDAAARRQTRANCYILSQQDPKDNYFLGKIIKFLLRMLQNYKIFKIHTSPVNCTKQRVPRVFQLSVHNPLQQALQGIADFLSAESGRLQVAAVDC